MNQLISFANDYTVYYLGEDHDSPYIEASGLIHRPASGSEESKSIVLLHDNNEVIK